MNQYLTVVGTGANCICMNQGQEIQMNRIFIISFRKQIFPNPKVQ